MVNSVVFIDSRVPDLQTLIDGANPSQLVFVLDPGSNGIAQIATLLAENDLRGLDAISIVGHGFAGGLLLGSTSLDQAGLESLAKPLTQIGGALGEDGDILLYACDVGQSETGTRFIFDLSRLTRANVAAASHPVGNARHGGSWDLDVRTGSIEATNPFSAETLADFQGVLAAPVTISPKPEGDRQYLPRLTGLGDGYSVVGWNDFSYSSFEVDTKFRIVGADGTPIGSAITIPDGGFDESIGGILSMGATANGFKFAVIYESWTNVGVPSILGKFYEFNTTTLAVTAGANFVVSNNPASDNTYPVATMVDANHFAVAWAYDGDAYSGGSFDTGMVIRLFDTNGNATSAITPIRTTADGISVSRWGSISSNGTNVTVQWEEGVGHIFLNNITTNGNGTIVGPVPAPVEVNIAGAELWSSIVMPSGEIMQLYSANGGDDLFFRLVSATAPFSQTRAPQQVNSTDTDFGTHSAAAVVLPSGGFVIAWIRADDANDVKLYARIFDENFVARTNDILVPNDTAFDQIFTPNIQRGPDGGVYIVWSYDGTNEPHPSGTPSSAFDNPDIVGRLFVNIGPTATGTPEALATIEEDVTNPAGTVLSSFLTDQYDDLDNHPLAGIAVRSNAATGGQGTWQYSTNGGSIWNNIATNVSDASALILAPSDLIRFVAVTNFNGNVPALSVRLWDGQGAFSTGTSDVNITGAIFDSNPNGGTLENPFTGNTIANSQFVAGINDAPTVANPNATLAAINEDNATPPGSTISSLFAATFSDAVDNQTVNGGTSANTLAGIAITANATSATQGTWQWSTGGVWTDIPSAVSNSSALLLAASTSLRFLPTANWNGTTPVLTVHLIDDSAGALSNNTTADLSGVGATGGTTRYSTATVALAETVAAVNDAPVVIGGSTVALGAIAEDTTPPVGDAVNTLFGTHFSDATDAVPGGSSAHTFAALAITVNSSGAGLGQWQYFNGASWIDIGAASQSSAQLINAGTSLRFNPAPNFNGPAPTLTAHLVDSSGAAFNNGDDVNLAGVGASGGTTRYSAGTVTLSQNITAVNDAPNVVDATLSLSAINEDNVGPVGQTVNTIFSASFSDNDDNQAPNGSSVNNFAGIAVVGNAETPAQGSWQWFDGASWVSVGTTVTDTSALLLATNTLLRFLPAANFNGTAPILTARLVEDTATAFTSGNSRDLTGLIGDPGSYSQGTIATDQTINPVNDEPAGVDKTVAINEDTAYTFSAADFGFTDLVDGNALSAVKFATIPSAGTLTNSGVAVSAGSFVSVTDINAGNLKLTPSADANGAGYASFTFQLQDDGGTANGGVNLDQSANTITFNVTPLNDAPTATITPPTYNATENITLNLKTNGLSVSDADANTGSMTVTLSVTEGTLNVAAGNSGAIVSGSPGGSVTITGTVAQINALLNTDGTSFVQYTETDDTPSATATLTLAINDNGNTGGGNQTAQDTATINITAVNDLPVVSNLTPSIPYVIAAPPQTLSSGATVTDADSMNLISASVTLTDRQVGDELSVNGVLNNAVGVNGITWSYTAATGVLLLIGSSALANYQALLDQVQYRSTSGDPSNGGTATSRDVAWAVNDGTDPSVTQHTSINVGNQAATVDLNGGGGGTNADQPFFEGGGAVGVATAALSITDPDDTNLTSATIVLTNAKAADSLSINGSLPVGITSSITTGLGTITVTLSGNTSKANYTTAIQQVEFNNGSDNPDTTDRQITVTVNDGQDNSNSAITTVHVGGVNDGPANTVPATQNVELNAATAIGGLAVTDLDSAGAAITTTLSVAHGTLTVASAGGAAVSGSGTGSVTLTGSAAAINTTLAAANNVVYQGALGFVGTDALTVTTNDGGNTGTGGSLSDTDQVTINVNPPPVPHLIGTPGDDSFTALYGNERIDAFGGIDTVTFGFRLVDATVTYVGNEVIIDSASSHTVLTGFERFVFTDGTVDNNDGTWLIDDLFYYSTYHDVWNAHVDADAHYNANGWHEWRDPSAFFSTSLYRAAYRDVTGNPLDQWHSIGWSDGRVPSFTFDAQQYLSDYPDVAAARVDPLEHFLHFGAQETRQPTAPDGLFAPNGFDFIYYLQQYSDVLAAHIDPFQHFQTNGWREGRSPNALFDTGGYLATYGDVAAAGVNPFDHYNTYGWHEGRDPSVDFDTSSYLAAYPDVAAAGVNPLVHYLHHGIHEGRSAFADGVWG